MNNRGRFQAQGKTLEKSVPWAKNEDYFISDGLQDIIKLENKLTKSDFELRKESFRKAKMYIQNSSNCNGVSAPISKSYRVKSTRSERVDIEVIKGIAFIPDAGR